MNCPPIPSAAAEIDRCSWWNQPAIGAGVVFGALVAHAGWMAEIDVEMSVA